MHGFKAAHAVAPDWGHACRMCLDSLGSIDADANLGFLYVTDALADQLSSIVTLLREVTKIKDWVGTAGTGICADGIELFDCPAMAVMVGCFPAGSHRVFGPIGETVIEFIQANLDWLRDRKPLFGVAHGDPRSESTATVVADLAEAISGFLVGGLTSGLNGSAGQVAGVHGNGGLSGVLFGPDIPVVVGVSQGCAPIGPVHLATDCSDGIVMSLDGRPALEVFKEEIGEELARDPHGAATLIHAALPVRGCDTGDFLVRNLVGIDRTRGWLSVAADLAAGDRIMFVRRDPASAREDLLRMLRDVKRRMDRPARAGLYFSCVARGARLFGEGNQEMGLIRRELGDIPLIGFYGAGEISHDRLYGYTGVLALFL